MRDTQNGNISHDWGLTLIHVQPHPDAIVTNECIQPRNTSKGKLRMKPRLELSGLNSNPRIAIGIKIPRSGTKSALANGLIIEISPK